MGAGVKAHHFDERIKCRVRALRYDFDRHTGRLSLPPRTKADRYGVIAWFETIEPGVRRIIIISPEEIGVVYVKNEKGDWIDGVAEEEDIP